MTPDHTPLLKKFNDKNCHFWYNLRVAIENDKEFEEKLGQLCRMYRTLRKIWSETNAGDGRAVAKWVATGGKVIDLTTVLLAELEDYTGAGELRLIIDQLSGVQAKRDEEAGKA